MALLEACTEIAGATRHFRRFTFARRGLFRRCLYSVCDTLTGQARQGVVAPLRGVAAPEQMQREAAGEARREAHR